MEFSSSFNIPRDSTINSNCSDSSNKPRSKNLTEFKKLFNPKNPVRKL